MSETDKRPFIEAADQNKKLKHQDQKSEQKQSSNDQSKTRATKSKAPNKSSSSRKPLSPKKRKVKVAHNVANFMLSFLSLLQVLIFQYHFNLQ